MCGMNEMLMGAGAGFGLGGTLHGGRVAKANARAQAHVTRNAGLVMRANADLEDTRRGLISAKSALDETRVRDKVDQTIGAQFAHFAANNLDPTTGSPLLMAAYTQAQGAVDIDLLRAQRELDIGESFGREASILNQVAGNDFQAAAFDQRAEDAMIASAFGAGTAFLSSATKWSTLMPSAPRDRTSYSLGTAKAASPWSF